MGKKKVLCVLIDFWFYLFFWYQFLMCYHLQYEGVSCHFCLFLNWKMLFFFGRNCCSSIQRRVRFFVSEFEFECASCFVLIESMQKKCPFDLRLIAFLFVSVSLYCNAIVLIFTSFR